MNAGGIILQLLLLGIFLIATPIIVTVKADFILTVSYINYTNPSGLCAECNTTLVNVNFTLDNIVPVCCDEMPLQAENCNNGGESRCNTRFRWILREYGGSLDTRPGSAMSDTQRVYFFNPCGQSFAMCPFNESSRTFEQGDTAFLGRSNPFLANTTKSWTGRIQFFIESLETALPNIIDSFLIDLDNLKLGADFTEEITYTGYHNISQMRMSFKVECAPNYCGPDCTVSTNDRRVLNCPTGEATCINDKLDPSLFCAGCIDNRLDISTDCLTCLNTAYDPVTNCSTCLNLEYNFAANCSTCLDAVYDPASCSTCLNPAYDLATNCSTCLNPNLDESTDCTTCLKDGYSPATNCSLCLSNRDLSTNCTSCLPGWDLDSDCTSCSLPRSDPNSNCTICLSGYTGEDCVAVTELPTTVFTAPTSVTISAALVGGIAGGVGGGLFIVIVVLIVLVVVLTCQVKRRGSGEFNVSDRNVENLSNNVYQHSADTGTGTSVEHKFQNPIYGSGMELKESETPSPTALTTTTGVADEHMIPNMLYDSVSVPKHEEYSQLRHSSTTPPSHKVKTGTNDFNSSFSPVEQDLPVYDSANYANESNLPREGSTPQQKGYSQLRHPSVSPPNKVTGGLSSMPQGSPVYDSANYTDELNQPVYDVADHPPAPEAPLSGQQRHPSKSAGAYEEVDDDLFPPSETNIDLPVYDVAAYPPLHDVPSSSAYAVLEEPGSEGPTDLPVYDVTEHNLPPSLNQQSSILGETATTPAGLYDTANYPAGSTTTPAGLYDTANYPAGSTTTPAGLYDTANYPGGSTTTPAGLYDTANYPGGSTTTPAGLYDIANYPGGSTTTPAGLYDTANYPEGVDPSHQYDYADTTVRAPPSELTGSLPSSKRHAYDYIDAPLDGAPANEGASVQPSVYANTLPGEITAEAEGHYDFGL